MASVTTSAEELGSLTTAWSTSVTREDALSVPRILLVSSLFLAPIPFGSVDPWAASALVVLVCTVLTLWAWHSVRRETLRLVWTPLYIPAGLFLAFTITQLLLHRTVEAIDTRNSLINFSADVLLFFLTVHLFAGVGTRTWNRFASALGLYAAALSVFAIVQFFSDSSRVFFSLDPGANAYVFGPYISHNSYAGLMEMLIPLTGAFLLSRGRTDRGQYLLGFALLLEMASVVVSGSRGGVLSVIVEATLFLMILMSQGRSRRSTILAVLVLVATLLGSWWMVPTSVRQRFTDAVHGADPSYQVRGVIRGDALRIAHDYLLTGTGLGTFAAVYPQYQSLSTDEIVDEAHNDYVQAVVETGVIGPAIIASVLVLFLYRFRSATRFRSSSVVQWMRAGAVVACCGLLVHSWADFNLHIPANAAWFAFCAGLSQVPFKPAALQRTA